MARRSLTQVLLAPRVAALVDALPRAWAGDVEGVHQARVASRRVREALPVCADELDDAVLETARKAARRVTRALGPVRELDVSLGLFAARAATLDPLVKVAIDRGLVTARRKAFSRAKRALAPARQREIRTAVEGALTGQAVPRRVSLAALDARLARRVARVRTALAEAGALYVPERLHRVRIAVKQLRYASELAGEARRTRGSSRVATLRALQDLLGLAHDLHALAEQLGTIERRSVRRSRRTALGIAQLIASLDAECRQLHAAFMSRRGSLRGLCDALESPRAGSRAITAA